MDKSPWTSDPRGLTPPARRASLPADPTATGILQPAGGEVASLAFLGRVDPRLRIVTAATAAVLLAAAHQFAVLGAGLIAAVLAIILSGLPLRLIVKRLLPLEALMLLLTLALPVTTPGTTWWSIGTVAFSREGLHLAAAIAMKGNAIVLLILALLGSFDANTLGHALAHLYVPEKLTHLLLLSVRYLDVLQRESLRLRAAMKVRGFRPRVNLHTYRSYGYLVGMMLVRSFDRSERIAAAMKCRGFRGRFYLLDHFHFSRCDMPFAMAAALVLLALAAWEWL
jgi:cobalt/nickel transport system permease protein